MALASSTLGTAALIAALTGTAASTGMAIKQATKGMPPLPKAPIPPPPPPPPAAAAPPFAPDTAQGEPQARAKRRREQSYGVEQTILTSPIGGGQVPRAGSKTILGG
jgi:hypothetical protein